LLVDGLPDWDHPRPMVFSFLYVVVQRLLEPLALGRKGEAERDIEIVVLRHQLAVLRRQVKLPVFRPADRAFLAAASRVLSRERWRSFLVRPETLLQWHRRLVARKWTTPHRPPGRPALDLEVRDLILRLARENPRWGYQRIRGELLKLGIRVSATTVATLLRRHGLGPAPRRGPTWGEFLRQQAAGIMACDFFTVQTIRLKTLYVLFFIELGTRRVHIAGASASPDSAWVAQQARNLAGHGRLDDVGFLIRDRDTKFSGPFDEVFRTDGVRVITTPIRAPNANAIAQRWVATVRAECLDWVLVLGRRHLERVLATYVKHYNEQRPHRGLESSALRRGLRPLRGAILERDGAGDETSWAASFTSTKWRREFLYPTTRSSRRRRGLPGRRPRTRADGEAPGSRCPWIHPPRSEMLISRRNRCKTK
jgi:putative transposase